MDNKSNVLSKYEGLGEQKFGKIFCFACLRPKDEINIENYVFKCVPIMEIFQMNSILLCHLCKRIAQYTESFVQRVQDNQILMGNLKNHKNENLKSITSQKQPLINLQVNSQSSIEINDQNENSKETFVVVDSKNRDNMRIKVEIDMKEEYNMSMGNFEEDFVTPSEDFLETNNIKEEAEFPLKELLKEELEMTDIDSMELMNMNASLKKNKLKKKNKTKQKKIDKKDDFKYNIEMINLTKEQSIAERKQMAQDSQYLEQTFKCTDCIKGFSYKGSYDQHMERHCKSSGSFVCDVCKLRWDTEEKLVSHVKLHFTRFKCLECGLLRKNRLTIKDHYSVFHTQLYQYACPKCPKYFKRQETLRKHMNYKHKIKQKVTCAYCLKTYVNKDVLRSHMANKHPEEVAGNTGKVAVKKYVCQDCGKAFRTPSGVKNHSIKHSDIRDYYCVECDKSFKSKATLMHHLKTAAVHVTYSELPLPCSYCDKRFSIKRDLDRHTNRIHLNVKPFACDKCDKAYVNNWALKEHTQIVHEGYQRPLRYPCPMCDKVFNKNTVLKGHIRTHTGERPYQCSKCPARFSQAGILRSHDRLVHLKLTRNGTPKATPIK